MENQNSRNYSRGWLYTTLVSSAIAFYEGLNASYCMANPDRSFNSLDQVLSLGAIILAWKGLDKIRQNSNFLENQVE